MKRTTAARIRIVKGELQRKLAAARRQVSDGAGRVNVAGRVNAVVVRSNGQAGSVQAASSRQRVHIRQSTGESVDPQGEAQA